MTKDFTSNAKVFLEISRMQVAMQRNLFSSKATLKIIRNVITLEKIGVARLLTLLR